MTLVLSKSELDRIKKSTLPPEYSDYKTTKKADLKALSEARQEHWPNTLQALRKKKESFIKDKEEREEQRRQEIDREEAEIRRIQRLESIRRANELLYEQTDKMKMLKSQKLYSDVVFTRSQQMREKEVVKVKEIEKEQHYHEAILKQVESGNLAELEKSEKRKQVTAAVVEVRRQQLEDVRRRREEEAAEQRAIGLAMKSRAQQQFEQDLIDNEQKQRRIKQKNEEMVLANEKMKQGRDEVRRREAIAGKEREGDIQVIDDRQKARKAIEIRRFEKSQETRQKLIDAAVKQLNAMQNNEQAFLQKQEDEIKAKNEKALADKEAKRLKDWNETVHSRTEQLVAKDRERQRKIAEEEVAVRLAREAKELADRQEKEKEMKAKETVRVLKALQLAETIETRQKKVEQRMLTIEEERVKQKLIEQDNQKFTEICKGEIKKYAAEGKPIHTLLRALEHTQPDLIPAELKKVSKHGEGK